MCGCFYVFIVQLAVCDLCAALLRYFVRNSSHRLYLLSIHNYSKGGDGLCCASGEGSYAVYNKGELLLIGNAFGTSEENPISIDPKDFIETETGSSSGGAVSGGNETEASGSGSEPIASFNTLTTPPPTTEETAAPIPTQLTSSPVPTAKPVSPSAEFAVNQERWYCGSSWDWIIRNCAEAIPCPGGDASGTY